MHDADRNQIVTLIQAVVPDVRAVYRFGSSGTGATHAESDLDLAVLPPVPLPAPTRWDLEQDLSIALRRDVDLVDLRSASTVMRMQVVSTGTVLFESDRAARQAFEVHTYSASALLNEERTGILDDIRKRGRVYGR